MLTQSDIFSLVQILAVTEGYTVSRTLSSILEDLESVTAAPRPPYGKDLTASVDALRRLINYNAASGTRPLSNDHDITNLVKISSNLLELANLPAWKTALKVIFELKFFINTLCASRSINISSSVNT